MQTIVLRTDYQSSTKIEELQKQANAANLKRLTALPPHLTLQSFNQANPVDLKKAIEHWALETKQFKISFSSLGFFKEKGIFFLAPVLTDHLAAVHRSLFLSTREFESRDILYQPEQWVPHATLAMQVASQYWGPLFSRLSLEFEPFDAKITAIECWSIINGRTENEWSIFLA